MNSITWKIEPNLAVWALLGLATFAICSIAWYLRRLSRGNTSPANRVLNAPQSAWRNVERAVTWLSFVLVLIGIGYLTTIGNHKDKVTDFSALATVMGVLVTLLVGWQIYSTIEANKKIASIKNELTTHHHYVNARIHFTQGQNLMQTTLSLISQNKSNNTTTNPAFVGNLCVAYRNYLEALTHYLQSNKDIKAINSCVSNMDVCLNNLQKENVEFAKTIGDKCDSLYDALLLMEILTSHKLQEQLTALNQKRTKITR